MTEDNKNHLLQLWPVTLLKRTLDNHQNINAALLALFESYRKDHSDPVNSGGSNKKKSSFVSPDNFSNDMDHPALNVLKTFIMNNIYDVACNLNQQYWQQCKLQNIDVDITGLWFQICNDYTFHDTHVHGNCSWSGVYYVQSGSASKDKDDVLDNGMLNGVTRFYGPNVEHSAAGHGDWGNYYLQDNIYTHYPADGDLIIFPSYLKHMAYPYYGDKDRVIVSFHAQVNSKTEVEYKYSLN